MIDFHNPRPQVHRQNVVGYMLCWLYAQQLKLVQENYQTYIQTDSLGQPFDL